MDWGCLPMISADIEELGIEELRARLSEAENNLMAIYSGEIDALLLADESGERRVFTLRSADAPYRALVERMHEGAATLSVEGNIVYCNQRFADLVNKPLTQVFGTPVGAFLPATEAEILRTILEHGTGRYVTRLVLEGVEATEVQITVSSIVLDDIEHRTLIMSDISSLARAQRENRSKDEFLAMLAHELRNPLGAIQGAVHALSIIGHSDPMALRATGIIKRQVVHMARLVDDLLDVGRAVTGKIVLKRRPVNFSDCVRSSVTTLAAGNPNFARIQVDCEQAWVSGDAVRLEQIVGNLISNALKFSQSERPVLVSVKCEDGFAVLRVSDQGVGIPEAMLPRIFDLFVQAHHTIDRSRGGLGIGLTLVKRLAELHGGNVQANSGGDGRGATFTVRIPLTIAPDDRVEGATGASTNNGHVQRYVDARRVLLVDDNHDSREMYRAVLRANGHDVREAPDGERALKVLDDTTFDVAFIDIGLPGGMDGYELARRIRSHPMGQNMRLVALTGYGFPEDRAQSRQAGFARHLVKPVEPDVLQRELSSLGRPGNGVREGSLQA
jgi:signal transduction histidine kinase/ActR/RegA family two-component response regulator